MATTSVPWDQTPEYVAACRTHRLPGEPNEYDEGNPVGATATDRTDFQIGLAQWHIGNLPNVFYDVFPSDEWKAFKNRPKPRPKLDAMGQPMLEKHPRPGTEPRVLLDFPILRNINRISTAAEGWFLELLMRLEPRLEWEDIDMRMENSGKRRNTKTKFINSLQMRCSRFRERCTMVSWAERSDGKSSNQTRADILARLSPAQMAARSGLGTSRGTAPGSLDHLGNTIAIPTGRDRPPPYIAANVPRRAQAAVPILVNDNSRPGRTRVLPSSNNPSQQTRRFVPSAASSSRRSNIIQTSRKDDLFEDDVLGNDLVGEDLLGNACGGKAQDSDQSPYMKHHEEHEAQSTKRARDADETEDESDEIHGPPRKRTKRSSPTARKGTKAVLSPAIEGPFIQRVIEQQRQNPPPSLNNDLGNSDTEAWASDPNATMNLAPVATKSRPRTFRSGPSAVAALHADRARRPVPRATIGQTLNHPADYPGLSFEMGHYWTGPQRLQNTDSRSQRSSHSAAATSISQRIIVERATSQEFNNSAHTPPPPENTQCHTATAHPSESYTAAYLESSYGFADWPNPLLSTLDPLLLLPATASTTTTNIPTYDPSLDEIYFPDPSPATTATIDHQSPNPQRTSHDIFFPPMPVDDVLLRHDLPALSREDWESIEWAINWGGGGG